LKYAKSIPKSHKNCQFPIGCDDLFNAAYRGAASDKGHPKIEATRFSHAPDLPVSKDCTVSETVSESGDKVLKNNGKLEQILLVFQRENSYSPRS